MDNVLDLMLASTNEGELTTGNTPNFLKATLGMRKELGSKSKYYYDASLDKMIFMLHDSKVTVKHYLICNRRLDTFCGAFEK